MEENKDELPNIRTLKTDAESFARENKLSPLDMATRAYTAGKREAPSGLLWKAVVFSAIFALIIAGAAYFSYVYFFKTTQEPIPEPKERAKSFLQPDSEKPISFRESDPGALINSLLGERKKRLRSGAVVYFPIDIAKGIDEKQPASAVNFAQALSWKTPGDFLDNLLPHFNTFVVYGQNSNDVTLIFQIKSFERALASLLGWERTIWLDWKPFLAEEDVKNISKFAFRDRIIKNNDTRVLSNAEGKTILGYSIFNKKYLIMSTSADALAIVLERLITLPPR